MAWAILLMVASATSAQRVRPPTTLVPAPRLAQGSVTRNPLAPVPPATLGSPTFDPYTTAPTLGAPSLLNPTPPSAPVWQPAAPAVPAVPAPATAPPVYPQQPPVLFPNGLGQQQPSALFPNAGQQQPGVLFPNGLGGPNWPQAAPGPYLRLFQDIRLRYTWVAGGDGTTELDTQDIEAATTVNFPNFVFSGQPLRVSPGFIFHFWDGPDTPALPAPQLELPSRAYSAHGTFSWDPVITPQLGGEIDVNLGLYTDFQGYTNDALRLHGTGLLVLGLTPTVALKAGIVYLDRVDLKLLPAAGILWQPNPQTRFDIYFPKPKLAQFLTTVGNTDLWWYLHGEYGGGSWTVERTGMGGDRRMDINDIRVGLGLEATHQFGWRSFIEAAYVFDREIIFASGTIPDLGLDESVMVRGGLAY